MKRLLLSLFISLNIITAQKPLMGNHWTQHSGVEINDIFEETNEQPLEGDPAVLDNFPSQHLNANTNQREDLFNLSRLYQSWDGTQWLNNYQYTYNYDVNNNQAGYLYQTWDGTQWVNNRQYTYTYDTNNNRTSYLWQNWDGTQWVNNSQRFYTYNANNNRTSELGQGWDGNQWVNDYQQTWTYDANNNQTSYLHQTWDGTQWVNSSQNTNTYDANNNQTSYLYQTWDGTQWVNNYQYTYTYDSSGNQVGYLNQNWDGTQWVNNTLNTRTYDVSNNSTLSLYQTWSDTGWVNSRQYIYTYDANNNRTGRIRQQWDGTQWVNDWQYTYTFDANNNQTSDSRQDWDGNQWVNDYQNTYTFDANNNQTSYLRQNWDGTQWVNDDQITYTYDTYNNMTSYLRQNWDGTQWVNDDQVTFIWGALVPVISSIPDQEMDEDQTLVLILTAQSPISGGVVVFSASSDTSAVSVDVTVDTLNIVPAANWGGMALITVIVDAANGTSDTTSFNLIVHKVDPVITYIEDVPEDQGGWVYVGFLPSYHDSDTISSRSEMYSVERFDDDQWVNVASGVAYDEYEYVFLCPTTKDSTSFQNGVIAYRVIASMDEGIYLSLPDSGYSVDNIAPGVPTGLMLSMTDDGLMVSWDESSEADFQYYMVQKSADSLFATDQYGDITTAESYYLDIDYQYGIVYYRVSVFDYAGNEGDYSNVLSTSILGSEAENLIPDEFALRQNYPNPFNPVTTLRYDLPENSHVNITIYDMLGRQVKTLINQAQDAGYRSVIWNATNDYGKPVSAGIYLYQIQVGEYISTKKMVLLK